MNKADILFCMMTELGKLLHRSEEKPGSLKESTLKFLHTHAYAFNDVDELNKKLQEDTALKAFWNSIFEEEKEACHLPFIPGQFDTEHIFSGFLVHIYKGEQDIVPISRDEITITSKQYYRLLHTLRHDLKRLENPPSLEVWLHLIHRYTKWIPANANCPYISLADYIKTKMAITACLEKSHLESWQKSYEEKKDFHQPIAKLMALKFTGLDEFLFQNPVGKKLNVLKGKIYSSQLWKEFFLQDLLKHLDLPLCNCLSSSGNQALLMIRVEDQEKAEKNLKKHEVFMLDHFQGKFSFAKSFMPITVDQLKDENFSSHIDELWKIVDEKASRPHSDLLSQSPEMHAKVFGPLPKEDNLLDKDMENLGKILIKARWLALGEGMITGKSFWEKILQHFSVDLKFLSKKPDPKENIKIYRFGNSDFACPTGYGFKFSEALPYLMAEQTLEPYNIKHWAIIHLKIDEKEESKAQSLCSYLTTNEYLRDFFQIYLAALLREKKYRKYTYLLHTEKHRLMIVCSPKIAVILANQIYKKFRDFTSENYTLSGRLQVFPSEYPIEQAICEEKQQFMLQHNLVNKIMLMEEIVTWPFMESMLRSQSKLATIAKLKGKRFLFPLLGIANLYKKLLREENKKKQITKWRHIIHYYMNRLGITDNLEVERGPVYLSLVIHWNHLMSQEP